MSTASNHRASKNISDMLHRKLFWLLQAHFVQFIELLIYSKKFEKLVW